MNLLEDDSTVIGSIRLLPQEVIVKSLTNCDNNQQACEKTFTFASSISSTSECELVFTRKTWAHSFTTLMCDGQTVELQDTEGVLQVEGVEKIRYVALENIGSYEINCPGNHYYN